MGAAPRISLERLRAIAKALRDQRPKTGRRLIRTTGPHDLIIDYDAPADAPIEFVRIDEGEWSDPGP